MTVGRVGKFAFASQPQGRGAIKYAEGGDVDATQDKAMIRKAVREHETAQHGGKHEPLKLARGGQARLPIGTKAIALQEHSPINNQRRAMRAPQTAMAKTPMDIMGSAPVAMAKTPMDIMGSAPPEPDMPQMYGNAAKKRAPRVRMT